jgi:hypothetical protein
VNRVFLTEVIQAVFRVYITSWRATIRMALLLGFVVAGSLVALFVALSR